jgi:hypothetical protein
MSTPVMILLIVFLLAFAGTQVAGMDDFGR